MQVGTEQNAVVMFLDGKPGSMERPHTVEELSQKRPQTARADRRLKNDRLSHKAA